MAEHWEPGPAKIIRQMKEFDQFHVPPLLLRELYRENLVALNDHQVKTPDAVRWKEQSAGKHINGLLIVVDYPGETVMEQNDLQYLGNILAACKRTLEDSLILNMAGLPADTFSSWGPAPAARYIWMIGMEPQQISLPARFPAFQVQTLGDITYLWTPPLSALQDKEGKTKLWNALKQMFRIA